VKWVYWIDNRKGSDCNNHITLQMETGRIAWADLEEASLVFPEDLSRDKQVYDLRDNKFFQLLSSYYDDVMDCIRGAEFHSDIWPGGMQSSSWKNV